MAPERDIIKLLEKNPSPEHVKSILKAFTPIEKNIITVLHRAGSPLNIKQIRNKLIEKIMDSIKKGAIPDLSKEKTKEILSKISRIKGSYNKRMEGLDKIFTSFNIKTPSYRTIEREMLELEKQELVLKREITSGKTKALWYLNPSFDVFLKKIYR